MVMCFLSCDTTHEQILDGGLLWTSMDEDCKISAHHCSQGLPERRRGTPSLAQAFVVSWLAQPTESKSAPVIMIDAVSIKGSCLRVR